MRVYLVAMETTQFQRGLEMTQYQAEKVVTYTYLMKASAEM